MTRVLFRMTREPCPRNGLGVFSFLPGWSLLHPFLKDRAAESLRRFFERFRMTGVSILYLRDSASLYGEGLHYSTEGSAGMDLRACMDDEEIVIPAGGRAPVPSGICIEPDVPDVASFVYSRSGLGAVKGLVVAQGVGVIDADYRGEIVIWLLNTSDAPLSVRRGDRVAQLVFQPVCRMEVRRAESLSETTRGSGGFGHTGRA